MVHESLSVVIAAFLISAGLIRVILVVAHKLSLYEKTDHRRTHSGNVPFLGGVAIFLGFCVAAAAAYTLLPQLHPARAFPVRYPAALLLAGFTIHITGVVDDLYGIPALGKLALQLLAAGIAVSGGVLIDQVSAGGIDEAIPLGALSIPLTVLWIVGVSNAVNLLDGMDGLAGGVSLIVAVTLGIWAVLAGNPLVLMLCSALTGALVGFLLFNRPPARVFMGDGGSLFLGFSLAVLPLLQGGGAPQPFVVPALMLLLIVPAADTLAAIIRRTARGIPFYEPDREHIHHKLQDLGVPTRQALLVLYAVCLLGAVSATVWLFAGGSLRFTLAPAVGVLTSLAVRRLYSIVPPAAPAETLSRLMLPVHRLGKANGTQRRHNSGISLHDRRPNHASQFPPVSQPEERE